MAFHPFEVNAVHLAYTLLGGFVVIFGMLSLIIKEKLYMGEAPIAVVTGIIIGPYVLNLFDPRGWGGGANATANEITLEVTRVVIAISVFAVGVELPKAYMKRHWRSLFFLLGPCMLFAWMVSALLIWGLVPSLTFLSSLVVAAAVTPTDPILAQAVIGGKFADKHVPAHIRHILSAESGSNDGAAFPFLGIALYLTIYKSTGEAIGKWFYYTIAYEIILGVILGALLGFSARKFMKFAERRKLIDRQSYVAQYVSLAILSIGGTSLLGSDDLLSAFACGCAFAWDGFFNKATEDAVFSNVIDLLFNCAAFIYIGAIIPFDTFNNAEMGLHVWRLVVLAICVLLLRRMPIILALYKLIPDIKTLREAFFIGWFGPMGVGAVFIVTLAVTSLPEDEPEHDSEQVARLKQVAIPIVSFLVLSSVITHGMSIPFFSLGRRVHSITYTWSRNPSMDTRRDNEPAWTTHARRIEPGQEIVINRDEDPEEGDLGMRTKEKEMACASGEKISPKKSPDGESGASSSSRTAGGDEGVEMRKARHDEEEQSSQEERESAEGEAIIGDDGDDGDGSGDGQNTPPLAQYREGNHLVIERKRGDGDEVEVKVIRNHFSPASDSEQTTFRHPHHLKVKEVDRLVKHLPLSLEHAVSHVEHHGAEAIDRLGLGLMTSNTSAEGASHGESASPEQVAQELDEEADDRHELAEEVREAGEAEDTEESFEDINANATEKRDPRQRRRSLRLSSVKSALNARQGIRQLFGRRQRSPSPSLLAAEEGRARSNPSPRSPISARPEPNPTTMTAQLEQIPSDGTDRSLSLTRTTSTPRIRFAPGSSVSSDSAPGRTNYGANNPAFKRNPALAMSREPSVQSTGSQRGDTPSVSFIEPIQRR